jgi:hypothetical protein
LVNGYPSVRDRRENPVIARQEAIFNQIASCRAMTDWNKSPARSCEAPRATPEVVKFLGLKIWV